MKKRSIFRKSIIFSAIAIFCALATFLFINNVVSFNDAPAQVVRTVSYDNYLSLEESALVEFDKHQINYQENNDIEIVASKTFDMELFEELDLVSLDETEETVNVQYDIVYDSSEEAVLLTVSFEDNGEVLIETIPGLVTYNDAGESDVLFVIEDETIWLSELEDLSVIDSNGWFSKLIKKVSKVVTNVVTTVAKEVVKALASIIKPAIRLISTVSIQLLGAKGSAAIGAWFLNMSLDETGKIYHANFDCWQQYFGYTDFYDVVFDSVTSMRNAKFDFDVNADGYSDYILWAWKGDYLNLGAGAELGIYERWDYSDVIWKIDKNNAMKMTLKLDHKTKGTLFDWQPTEKQWWITGFDYNTQNVNRDDLTATFTVTFTNTNWYSCFKKQWESVDSRWKFDDTMKPTLTL